MLRLDGRAGFDPFSVGIKYLGERSPEARSFNNNRILSVKTSVFICVYLRLKKLPL
jgi:hypothetical protein